MAIILTSMHLKEILVRRRDIARGLLRTREPASALQQCDRGEVHVAAKAWLWQIGVRRTEGHRHLEFFQCADLVSRAAGLLITHEAGALWAACWL